MNDNQSKKASVSRRGFLAGTALAATGAIAAPYIWVPKAARAQLMFRGAIKHVLYVRLSGGFRFPTAFNADVSEQFNPFGLATGKAAGAEWGMSKLLEPAPYLEGMAGAARVALGMRPVGQIANEISVLPCVDHEPKAGSADGNHGTGLERYLTGYVGGKVGLFTMLTYGLREQQLAAQAKGELLLPPFVLGSADMARGLGKYAAFRPPVFNGGGFDQFGFKAAELPDWANRMIGAYDSRMKDRQHPLLRDKVDAYLQTRKATKQYSEILGDEVLKVGNRSMKVFDGISNAELDTMLGTSGSARSISLALRLFHFGSPAVYLDQGGYDMHSGEEDGLPGRMIELSQLISGTEAALKKMVHPAGGSYWDHTVVVFGSEFSRTTRGNRFNSARGSDHSGDFATRWMSMPIMGGPIVKGKQLGSTDPGTLKATGTVYSYRSLWKTLMEGLGADHQEFFTDAADAPFADIFA
ncbi:MAG: DUF1501 domain-containing protein [Polyangiaceae bacterium]|nr:DUF1501 domain-containing protein [Polyangiaceae bacterium]